MEDKIKLLYALQKVDSKLMELEELKGDLPRIVKGLTGQIDNISTEIETVKLSMEDNLVKRDNSGMEAEALNDRINSLKKQLYEVRNNKEYDAISKEITSAEEKISELLDTYDRYDNEQKNLKGRLEELNKNKDEVTAELDRYKEELNAVSKTHEEEELQLKHEKEKVLVRLSTETLAFYERISTAKDGRAVVPVKRGACGGCYNTIPPQVNLLLRKNEELITCENCGRILIDEEIAAEVNRVA